jgi:hypothetical protein
LFAKSVASGYAWFAAFAVNAYYAVFAANGARRKWINLIYSPGTKVVTLPKS